MPKKFTKITALALLILTLTSTLLSCGGPMPQLEDVRERIVYLIDASHEINEIFFGKGLPTYPRIDAISDIPYTYSQENEAYYLYFEDSTVGRVCKYSKKDENIDKYALVVPKNEVTADMGEPIYTTEEASYFAIDYTEPVIEYVYTEDDDKYYDVVRADSKYLAVYEIKEAAEKVYSPDYLEGIYQVAFEGIGGSSYGIKLARFYTEGGLLKQYNQLESYIESKRIYDYSTLKIVRPSNDQFMNVTVDTHIDGEDEILKVTLRFIKGEDGEWYLDSPTY